MAPATAKPQILTIDDLEEYAALHLPKMVRDYYNGGSMDAYTLASSLEAYRRWYIMPRVLRDVSRIDTTARVFDQQSRFPAAWHQQRCRKWPTLTAKRRQRARQGQRAYSWV